MYQYMVKTELSFIVVLKQAKGAIVNIIELDEI